MGGDSSETIRRKRPSAGRNEKEPPAKKLAKAKLATADGAASKAQSRKIIATVYKRYCLLSNPAAVGQENAFQALLDSCEGDLAARRLASRLIPRFAARFPEKLETAARCLMDLSTQDPTQLPNYKASVAEATRLEALRGLGDLCCAATAHSPDSRTASSIVLHFFRRIQQLKSKKRRGREAGRGAATENGSHGSRASSSTRAEQDAIASSLATALQGAPRAVLEACLECLGYGSGELYEAAKDILAAFLKPPATPPTGDPRKETEGANMVTRALEPAARVAQWLRDAVQATLGRRSAVPADMRQLLEKLLGSLPQSRASSPAAKPSHSRVTTSPAKHDASAKASPSKSVAATSLPSAKHGSSSNDQESAKAKAAQSPKQESAERVPTGGLKKSALPEHLAVNGSTPSRVESGELMEDVPSRGGSVKARLANGETRAPREGRTNSSERHKKRGGSSEGVLDTLPVPGGSVCAAVSCLWLAGLGQQTTQSQILELCREHVPVEQVFQLPPPMHDQALVFFSHIGHAWMCYEALGSLQSGRTALEVQFCEVPPGTPLRPGERERAHVWVAGDFRKAGEDQAMRVLEQAGIQRPVSVLPVGGRKPGLILEFASTKSVSTAVKALRASMGHAAAPFASRRERSRSPLRGRDPLGPPGPSPHRLPSLPLPDFASCTLWVGQVGPDVSDDQLAKAFSRIGPLKGYKVLRKSNCAFIDFEHLEDAAEARTALHDQPFGMWNIRVEWKEEGMAMGRGPRQFMRGMPRRGGRGAGRRGGFRGGIPDSPLRYRDGRVGDLSPPRMRGSPSYGRARSPPLSLSPERSLRRSPRRSPRGRASPATRKFKWDLHPANPISLGAKGPSRSRSPMRRSKSPARGGVRGRSSQMVSPDADHASRRSSKKESGSAVVKKPDARKPEVTADSGQQGLPRKDTKPATLDQAGDSVKRVRKWDVQGLSAAAEAPQAEGVGPSQSAPAHGQADAGPSQEHISKKARKETLAQEAVSLPAPTAMPPPLPHSTPQPLAPDITSPALHPPAPTPPPLTSTVLPSPQASGAARDSAALHAHELLNGRSDVAEAVSTSGRVAPAVEMWTGKLAKSGVAVCSVQCKGLLQQSGTGAAGLEPLGWPPVLDVTLRIDTNYVLQQVYAAIPAGKAVLLRLVLAGDPDTQASTQSRFKDFCAYLTSRSRAGVVQNVPPAQGLPKRTLYLIPPTPTVMERFQVVWDQQELMLIALIVPAASK